MTNMKHLLALLSFLSLLSFGAKAGASLPDAECNALKKIIAITSSDFKPVKTDSLSGDKWSVSLVIPNSQDCYIVRRKRISYECESKPLQIGTDDPTALSIIAAPIRGERADAIKECLGPTWNRQMMFEEFYSGVNDVDAQSSIIVTIDRNNLLDPPYLRTSIARMNQIPLEAPGQSAATLRPGGYCDQLKEQIEEVKNKFTYTIAKSLKNDMGRSALWKTERDLSGWKDCYVHEWFQNESCRYLTCTVGPLAGDKEAENLMKSASSDLRTCLGGAWRQAAFRNSKNVRGIRFVKSSSPSIELIPTESLYNDHNKFVSLSVRTEAACKP